MQLLDNKHMHHPGVEPGSRAWKAHILTVGLMVRADHSSYMKYIHYWGWISNRGAVTGRLRLVALYFFPRIDTRNVWD